ncbi:glucosaminidase domain-containing protein [Ferrimonas marina]|uniref:Bax protein n=1 Tax=Ferrimonas marina TaxID=299255 RepID=A0A1M5NBV9_9GAMM|nr:glucosaminidase domain-containing protein [Ferrimonas marina]SHG86987.1 Bax protein [Ferrimonas marina]
MKTGRVGRFTLSLALVAAGLLFIQTQQGSREGAELNLPLKKNPPVSHAPNFASITDVTDKKVAFFDYLRPMIEEENQRILLQRSLVEVLYERLQQGQSLDETELSLLGKLAQEYRLELRAVTEQSLVDLLERIDAIPAEMVLVQAANESGWGTSRFALEGNNYFGQWCFTRGCGLVPNSRSSGLNHEVARFDSAQASVASYLRNLNTNAAYKELRTLRRWYREANQPVTAEVLIPTLVRYSERKEEYVAELLQMLENNKAYL